MQRTNTTHLPLKSLYGGSSAPSLSENALGGSSEPKVTAHPAPASRTRRGPRGPSRSKVAPCAVGALGGLDPTGEGPLGACGAERRERRQGPESVGLVHLKVEGTSLYVFLLIYQGRKAEP